MRLRIEIPIDCTPEAAPPSEGRQRREQEPLHDVGRLPVAELRAVAGGEKRPEHRGGPSFGVRVPIGAEAPEDEDRLLKPQRRLHTHASQHFFFVARVPPPMPGPGPHGDLLSRRQRALLATEEESDPSCANLEVLCTVVVDVLAARHKASEFGSEVGDYAGAVGLLG
jgi:hypothetical protein